MVDCCWHVGCVAESSRTGRHVYAKILSRGRAHQSKNQRTDSGCMAGRRTVSWWGSPTGDHLRKFRNTRERSGNGGSSYVGRIIRKRAWDAACLNSEWGMH